MSATASFHGAPDDRAYALIERRLQAMREAVFVSTPEEVLREFTELRTKVDADVQAIKLSLFTPSLASMEDGKAASRWISTQHRRLARVARRMAEGFARLAGPSGHTLRLVALGLHYMGESVKGPVKESHFHDGLHALMKVALASGRHRSPIRLEVEGRSRACTLASLYFRALLLARLAGGGLTFAQIEILDTWMWIWMPALDGTDRAPPGASWRADLDSNEGLRRGTRTDAGPSLYLAHAPLETAHLAIIEEFHCGRTVPATGDASKFAITDYVAVLDAVRRGLRGIRLDPIARAERFAARDVVELHVGLAEVLAKGFAPAGGIHDGTRIVQLTNVSTSGVGLEAQEAECADVAVDDLVALRIAPREPVVLARVVRRLSAETGGRVVIGLRRLSSAAQRVQACELSGGSSLPAIALLYVPGIEDSGQHDAYLTTEAQAAERELFETTVGDDIFTFRFNRVRESGRGWARAGFEITDARRRVDAGAAPPSPPAVKLQLA